MKLLLFCLLCVSKCFSLALYYTPEKCDVWQGRGYYLQIHEEHKGTPGSFKYCYCGTLYSQEKGVENVVLLALKTLDFSDDLKREYHLSQTFNSPYLIKHICHVVADGFEFLVSPRCESDLAFFFESRSLPLKTRISAAIQILEGLDELHQNTLTHGDVKLKNCFYLLKEDSQIHVMLGDFGLVKEMSDKLLSADTSECYVLLKALLPKLSETFPKTSLHELLDQLYFHRNSL